MLHLEDYAYNPPHLSYTAVLVIYQHFYAPKAMLVSGALLFITIVSAQCKSALWGGFEDFVVLIYIKKIIGVGFFCS
jgi:hypothetical protein